MKSTALIVFVFTLLVNVSAQDRNWTLYPKKDLQVKHNEDTLVKELNYNSPDGKVTLHQTGQIDSLQSQLSKSPFIYGYTVQIEVSQQKEIIKNARYRFLKSYPDQPLDELYNQPNTYLYGGRFYDKNTAYEFKNKISTYFPDAIVIRKQLDLPPLPVESMNDENE